MMNSLLRLAALAALLVLPTAGAAAVIADFTGGNGTAMPDQYVGAAGDGWAGAWSASGVNTTSTTVTNTGAFSLGGNYLKVVDNTTTGVTFVRRQYTSAGELTLSGTQLISFNFRFDGNISQFTAFNDRIGIFGDTTSQTGTGITNTWLVGVAGGNSGAATGQSVFSGNWYFFDNNGSNVFSTDNMVDTGIALVAGREYAFVIEVDSAAGTYSVTLDDGVNETVQATDLVFRRGTGAASTSWIHFNLNASTASDSSAFSIDKVAIVPEPAGLAIAAVAGLLLGRRRRRVAS
jgi:hypothetical protein